MSGFIPRFVVTTHSGGDVNNTHPSMVSPLSSKERNFFSMINVIHRDNQTNFTYPPTATPNLIYPRILRHSALENSNMHLYVQQPFKTLTNRMYWVFCNAILIHWEPPPCHFHTSCWPLYNIQQIVTEMHLRDILYFRCMIGYVVKFHSSLAHMAWEHYR